MKKLLLFLSFVLLVTSCRTKKTQVQSEDLMAVKETQPLNYAVENPELEKLSRVIKSMSSRCQEGIINGNAAEFLSDLREVLEDEKNFSENDLSPFFLIDKKHTVGSDYEPHDLVHLESNSAFLVNKNSLSLRREAYDALKEMGEAAKKDGVTLTVSSTYRSYEYQKNLFAYWVKVDGLEEAERESAREGTSQHQLGLALDFAPVDDAFAGTAEGQWVYKNAADFGWSLSFPEGYEDVTGYRWESWHFRYIGKKAVAFQKKWFSNVQQFMIEFIDEWKKN